MFQHYFKLAFRNQTKNKFFSIVNLMGLSVALAVSVLIINYVSFEFSFDDFHLKKDRVYRVESCFYKDGKLTNDWATSSFGYGSAIRSEMTGIEDYVRIGIQNTEQTVSYQEKRSREDGIAFAGHSFFTIFDFDLKEGSLKDQLVRPNTVVITENVAHRFFKNEDPIGKLLTFASGSNFYQCEVTGIMDDFPQNSHIHYNYIISYETLPDWMKEFWYLHEAYTYVLLAPGKKPAEVEAQFPKVAEKYKTADALRDNTWGVSLVPLTDIHLQPQKQYEKEAKGNRSSLVTLIVISILILVAAWINYVNLATARAMERSKDVGVRKVSGAKRIQLIRQYMMESWIVNFTALLVAILLVFALKPAFNHLTGTNLGLFILQKPKFWLSAAAVVFAGIVASGFYPAFIMTRIKTSSILKGNFSHSESAGTTRRALVIVQFAASLFLICGTFIIYRQVRFMENQSLGVNINKTVVLKYPVTREDLNHRVELFAKNLEEKTYTQSVSVAGSVPGMEVAFYASNRLQGDDPGQNRLYEMLTVDDQFVETFGLELLAGRSFQRNFGNEQENILINQSAMQTLGFTKPDDAIGKMVYLEGDEQPVKIAGVVKNWHQRGLSNAFTPIMFVPNGHIDWVPPRFIAIKTAGENYESIVNAIQKEWNSYFPEASFDYFFLDQFFDNQYKSDRRFEQIVGIFTALAFLISMMGLWALASFTASKKIKEVGVRKVLGAHIGNIIYLFSKEIIVLIIISLAVSTPISILVMKNWLGNYAFHSEVSLWIYILGGSITLFVALLTISWQSWKAATRNPVEALRYE